MHTHLCQCNKIPTQSAPVNDYHEELIDLLDMSRSGHYHAERMIGQFFLNLEKILGPFGDDIFAAAESFVQAME